MSQSTGVALTLQCNSPSNLFSGVLQSHLDVVLVLPGCKRVPSSRSPGELEKETITATIRRWALLLTRLARLTFCSNKRQVRSEHKPMERCWWRQLWCRNLETRAAHCQATKSRIRNPEGGTAVFGCAVTCRSLIILSSVALPLISCLRWKQGIKRLRTSRGGNRRRPHDTILTFRVTIRFISQFFIWCDICNLQSNITIYQLLWYFLP